MAFIAICIMYAILQCSPQVLAREVNHYTITTFMKSIR